MNKRLEDLEEQRRELRHEVARGIEVRDWMGRLPAEALADVESDISEARERLRALLEPSAD